MIILTGGAGFIGSAFLRNLNDLGHSEVLIVDELGTGEKWKNLRGKRFSDYMHKDAFLSRLTAGYDFGKVDAVIHMGANSSTTETDVESIMLDNYQYSKQLASWSIRHQARFIYASSAATYGDGSKGFDDDLTKIETLLPLNAYGFTKQAFDLWAKEQGLFNQIVGIKFFNVFGPNEYHKQEMRSVVAKSFSQIKNEGILRLFKSYQSSYGDGEQRRDFIYIRDCCEVMAWFLQNPEKNGLFNLGTGVSRTWLDLGRAVFSAMNIPERIEFIEMPEILREKYQYFTEAKMTRLQQVGCPVKFRSLEESVRDYVQNFLATDHPYL